MDVYEKWKRVFAEAKGEKRVVGKSLFGRDIFALKRGEGKPVGIVQYALHAREWITAELAYHHYLQADTIGSVWILPLTNPDGALLCQKGLSSVEKKHRAYLRALNQSEDFSLWKANGRGVDLNVNFDAEWGKGKRNIFVPASENFVGKYPFSEPETKALKRFTEEIAPDYTVSYHTKGEEIYWYFHQPLYDCVRDKKIALSLSEATGYPLALALSSVGGYKDWCIKKRGIPAFTIEAGKEEFSHPMGMETLPDLIKKNANALKAVSAAMLRT